MNKLKKVYYVLIRQIIKKIDYFNPRLYMKFYIIYLKKIGIDLYGIPRFIHPSVTFDGKGYSKTHIGENVVISRDVLFLNHDYSINCGLRTIGKNKIHEAYWLNDIYIGNNVFIGARVSILPGTKIGDNCIIGTGSIIKGNIPNNSILFGNPAKIVTKTDEWAKKKMEINNYFFED